MWNAFCLLESLWYCLPSGTTSVSLSFSHELIYILFFFPCLLQITSLSMCVTVTSLSLWSPGASVFFVYKGNTWMCPGCLTDLCVRVSNAVVYEVAWRWGQIIKTSASSLTVRDPNPIVTLNHLPFLKNLPNRQRRNSLQGNFCNCVQLWRNPCPDIWGPFQASRIRKLAQWLKSGVGVEILFLPSRLKNTKPHWNIFYAFGHQNNVNDEK